MRAFRMVTVAAIALIATGCAGSKSAQQMKQLQTQVGMLDERLGQLERWTYSSNPSAAGTSSSTASATVPAMNVSVGGTSATAPKKQTGTITTASKSSPKPSTREIQTALKNAGFYQGSVDGKMGPQTRDAVKEFQRVHGLKDDGIVGKQTWAKLSSYTDVSSGNELNAAEVLK